MIAALWAAVALLLILLLLCCLRLIAYGREAARLSGQIQGFINGEIQAPAFSVRDDRFAMFENAVIELETRLVASLESARTENAKNRAFVQDVSHQLKTPIAGLKLFCEVDESPQKGQMLKIIERMESLINSLLTLEKLRTDGYTFQYDLCDLRALAMDVRAQFTPLYPGKHIVVSGEASIRLDARWMYEALTNLVKNACEHTGESGHVHVLIEQSDTEAVLRVEDDGGGVPPEVLSRLFERFYRGLNPDARGVGLGLAIVKTIVMRHHGLVRAENLEHGLAVTLYLPILRDLLKKT